MKYQLDILFNEQDIKKMYESRQKLVLVKQTEYPADTVVAWICFNPWQKNTIEWDDGYTIYASTSKIEDVTIINKLYEEEAVQSTRYDFKDGPFNSPVKTSTYYVQNGSEDFPQITLGLAQNIRVNGQLFEGHPVNAFYVPYGQAISMTPVERVSVLIQKNIVSSMMLPYDTKNSLLLDFGSGRSKLTISYDGRNGRFLVVE